MSLTHNFSTRLSFYASIYAAYQNEPEFPIQRWPANVRTPHFDTSDIFSLTYHWSTAIYHVTSYTFERVQYVQSSVGALRTEIRTRLASSFNLI